MDSLIFLSGTAVFSAEQQPGSVLVSLMGERGEYLCISGSEQAIKAMGVCLKARGVICWLKKVQKLVTVEGQSGFLYPRLQQGFSASTICKLPPLINTVYCYSGLYTANRLFFIFWLRVRKKNKEAPCSVPNRAALQHHFFPAPRPPHPLLLILWIYLLMASLLTVPPISGISSLR